jgi:hypothetical protein
MPVEDEQDGSVWVVLGMHSPTSPMRVLRRTFLHCKEKTAYLLHSDYGPNEELATTMHRSLRKPVMLLLGPEYTEFKLVGKDVVIARDSLEISGLAWSHAHFYGHVLCQGSFTGRLVRTSSQIPPEDCPLCQLRPLSPPAISLMGWYSFCVWWDLNVSRYNEARCLGLNEEEPMNLLGV